MIAKIYTLKNGIEIIENVTAIRIKSKDYNLLLLKDYMPMIGEIEGQFEVETPNNENDVSYSDIRAYYVINNNVFSVLIEER